MNESVDYLVYPVDFLIVSVDSSLPKYTIGFGSSFYSSRDERCHYYYYWSYYYYYYYYYHLYYCYWYDYSSQGRDYLGCYSYRQV